MRRALFIAISLLLVLCPTALAKTVKPLGPVRVVSESGANVTGVGAVSQATVSCPFGRGVVGGGFSAPFASGSAVVVNDSYRSSSHSWTARGVVVQGTGSVTAYAYCRRTKGHPITDVPVSATLTSGGQVHTLTAECRAGRLIGGGFQSTTIPGSQSVLFPQVNLATSPTEWTVTEVANGDGPRTATAHAYCMRRVRAPRVLTQVNNASVPASGSLTSVTPRCPAAKRKGKRKLLSAGGFAASPVNAAPSSPVMLFRESGILPGSGWLVNAVNGAGSPGAVSVTSQAVCF